MSDLLDSTVKKKTVNDGFSNIQDRIRHLFIDGLIVFISSALLLSALDEMKLLTRSQLNFNVIALIIYSIYYTLMEFFFGFTIGKFLNKTRVVNLDPDNKPSLVQILIRTVTRLIPIGFVTIASPYKAAMNDLFSTTRTIRIKRKYVVRVNEI